MAALGNPRLEVVSGPARLVDIVWNASVGTPENVVVALDVVDADITQPVAIPVRPLQAGDESRARVRVPGTSRVVGIDVRWSDPRAQGERRVVLSAELDAQTPLADPPAWALGRVWYQVFPERFDNANPANDPRGLDTVLLPWDAPWYEAHPLEIEAAFARRVGRGGGIRPESPAGAFASVVYRRRYGGDLQGVVRRLDHLAALGVDGLYLCPVFAAPSLHKYDASDYRHVDPAFGAPGAADRPGPPASPGEAGDETAWPWTDADRSLVDVLLPAARARGIRVILDGVWNHVGREHWAFKDVARRGASSPYAGWFDAEFDEAGRLAGWSAWDGANGALPEFRQTDAGDINEGAKRHIFAVTRRWMDPNGDGDPSDGIDGWRLDVAAEIGRPFWQDWRALVRSINPDAYIVGEVWFDAADYFDGTAFDAQMNYPAASAIASWLSIRPGTTAAELAEDLRRVFDHAPAHDLAQMNPITSHDTERLVSLMANPGGQSGRGYDQGAGIEAVATGSYDPLSADRGAMEASRVAIAMLAVLPGSPMLYNGDEFAMPGADDPSNRAPIPWPDLGVSEERLGWQPDLQFAGEVSEWLGLRQDPRIGPVLRLGAWDFSSPSPDVVEIRRQLHATEVTALFGSSSRVARRVEALEQNGWVQQTSVLGDHTGATLLVRAADAR